MNSSQLDLWQVELDGLPWQGRSPRALTKVQKALFFKRERQERERFVADPDQLELWPIGQKAPWTYQGAPLLQGG